MKLNKIFTKIWKLILLYKTNSRVKVRYNKCNMKPLTLRKVPLTFPIQMINLYSILLRIITIIFIKIMIFNMKKIIF